MSQTPAQLRATKASKARRIAAGEKQFTVWLSKDAGDRLDVLTAKFGTRQKAMESVLMGQATRVAPEPVKAVQQAPAADKPAYGSRLKQR